MFGVHEAHLLDVDGDAGSGGKPCDHHSNPCQPPDGVHVGAVPQQKLDRLYLAACASDIAGGALARRAVAEIRTGGVRADWEGGSHHAELGSRTRPSDLCHAQWEELGSSSNNEKASGVRHHGSARWSWFVGDEYKFDTDRDVDTVTQHCNIGLVCNRCHLDLYNRTVLRYYPRLSGHCNFFANNHEMITRGSGVLGVCQR